jgi:hypothetical protein
MALRDVIAYCLVIALGIILALHFALFWLYGGVFIYESNKIVLVVETAMSVAILGFGFERLAKSTGAGSKRRGPAPSTKGPQHRSLRAHAAATSILRQATQPFFEAASTASTTTPADTALLIDSDARYSGNEASHTAISAQGDSGVSVRLLDSQMESTAHTNAV